MSDIFNGSASSGVSENESVQQISATQMHVMRHESLNAEHLPGAELTRQREARGWTILDVADQLNLAARQIVAIESNNYAALPAIAVVRGFIRAYARLLKIDPVPLLANMPANPSASLSEPVQHRTLARAQFSDTRLGANGYGKNGARWYSALLLAIMVIGGVALAQHFNLLPSDMQAVATKMKSHFSGSAPDVQPPTNDSQSSPAANEPSGATSTNLATNSNDAGTDKAALVSTAQIALPATSINAASGPAQPVTPTVADTSLSLNVATTLAKPALAADTSNRLVLNLRDDSWIEIRGAHSTVAAKLYRAGTTESFDITEPIQLIVGNAAGVDATLRGAPLVMQSSAKNNVARLNLK